MILIRRATENDFHSICEIGRISVFETHKESCSLDDMNEYIENHYSNDAIIKELRDDNNIYHVIDYNNKPVGFSKVNLNTKHIDITQESVTKLDRIYLLKEYQGFKLGLKLLKFNIELAKSSNQVGIWLYTWVGNKRAVTFYNNIGFTIIGSHNFYVTKTHYNKNHLMLLKLIPNKNISPY